MRQEFVQPIRRMIEEAGDDIDEIHSGIDTGQSTILDERVQMRQAGPGGRGANKQPLASPRLIGRMLFSTRLLSSRAWGVVTQRVSGARWASRECSALARALLGGRTASSCAVRAHSASSTGTL